MSSPSQSLLVTSPRSTRALWIAATAVVLADQISKWLVVATMDLYESIPVIGDAVRLTYIRNAGGAFGLRWGHIAVYYVSAAVIIVWIVRYLRREGSGRRLSVWALALILGGAIGNLIDRLLRGGEVIDFIDAEFFDLRIPAFDIGILHHPGFSLDRWPTFNVADSAVTVGVLALLFSLWHDPILGRRPSPSPDTSSVPDDAEGRACPERSRRGEGRGELMPPL